MKKFLTTFVLTTFALLSFIGGVSADSSRRINASACETIYTNYYFFLSANTTSYFAQVDPSTLYHDTIAEYHNNSYQISNFNQNNIGYGKVALSRTSRTSNDGITSMSMDDFYDAYLRASNTNGSFTTGTKNYIVSHDWYSLNPDGSANHSTDGLRFAGYSRQALKAASIDANVEFTLNSNVSPLFANPFQIRIQRRYTGYLTDSPVANGENSWYLQPAVYYIQYCSPVQMTSEYAIRYDGNGTNVSNVPSTQPVRAGGSLNVSSTRPVREGYTFLGWSENKTDTTGNPRYNPGNLVNNIQNDITLYAIWVLNSNNPTPTPSTYTVTYNKNATDTVNNMPSNSTVPTDQDVLIASNRPERSGFTFLGWATDSRVTVADPNYAPGVPYTDRKNLTLYAIWQRNNTPSNPPSDLPGNPQTGISDYLIPFGSVLSASGLGLGLLKKKKMFKQL